MQFYGLRALPGYRAGTRSQLPILSMYVSTSSSLREQGILKLVLEVARFGGRRSRRSRPHKPTSMIAETILLLYALDCYFRIFLIQTGSQVPM